MTLNSGERQVSPSVDGIRRDHVARYEWAASVLRPGSYVIDVGCGIGYGSKILAEAGHRVLAIDVDEETIAYAREHYAHERIEYIVGAVEDLHLPAASVAVCFEVIEHVQDPLPMLRDLRGAVDTLLASVPNEDVFPWKDYAFHFRHYTKEQFQQVLTAAGFQTSVWLGQEGPEAPVAVGVNGRTLLALAIRDEGIDAPGHQAGPQHVAIVGMGPSSNQYIHLCKMLGGRHKYADETWVINALGDILGHDRLFHMDDVRIQQIRADAAPDSNIAEMLRWLKGHPGPVITSRASPGFPGLVEFPLEAVLNDCPNGYFNSTAAYAVAYAIHIGVKKISCFGMDFTYPKAHDAEKGRACVEFWLGIAAERGIQLVVPKTTSLLDAMHSPAERFYGYDCVDLDIKRTSSGITVGFTEKTTRPTAEDIEDAYDHSRSPNALVEAGHIEAPENRARARAPEVK
jgi:SAM-dependent methyltransferase